MPPPALPLALFALAAGGLRNPWTLCAASVFLWGAFSSVPIRFRRVPGLKLWAAWLLWAGLSAAASGEPLRGLAALSLRASVAALFALAASGEDRPSAWTRAVPAAALALEAASLLIAVPGFEFVGVLYPYYNYTGAVAAVAVVLGVGTALREDGAERLFGAAAAALSAAWIVAAASRGGAVAAAAGVAVLLLRARRVRALAGLGLAGAAALALLFAAGAPLLKLDNAASNLRPRLWAAAAAVAADHPFLGEGPGQFDRGFLRRNFPAAPGAAPTRFGLVSKHAHSEFLQEAAETGIPGLLLLLAALWTALGAAARKTDARDPRLAACAAMLTHACFDNLFALPALHWLFFAMLGSACAGDGGDETPAPLPLAFAGTALALFAWWPAWIVAAARADGSESALRRGLAAAPRNPDLWADLARERIERGAPEEALAALQRAESLHPTHALHPLTAAEIFRNAGNWNAVLALTERVIELEPEAGQARLLRAQALLATGRKDEARREVALVRAKPGRPEDFTRMRDYPRFVLGYDEALLERLEAALNSGRRSR